MKSANILFLVLLITLACSSDRNDPVNPGEGGSSPGAGRANLAVVDSIQYEACHVMFKLIVDSYYDAIGVASSANDPDNPVRILGAYDGYAIVSEIDPDSNMAIAPYSWNMEIDYTQYYSDNGQLFIKGKLELRGSVIGTGSVVNRLYLDGAVECSGDYACSVEFEGFEMALDDNGRAIDLIYEFEKYNVCGPSYTLPRLGTISIESEGSSIPMFKLYAFDYTDKPPIPDCIVRERYGCPCGEPYPRSANCGKCRAVKVRTLL